MGLLDGLQEMMVDALKQSAEIDQLVASDEVAAKTDWSPAKHGGTNASSHSLHETSSDRVEFKMTTMALIQPIAFIVLGVAIYLFFDLKSFSTNTLFTYVPLLASASLILFALYKIFSWSEPRVFDRGLGCYWRGRKQPEAGAIGQGTNLCRLGNIHAIQLLKESIGSGSQSGSGSNYSSYELNLVLKDASRLNVIDHRNIAQIRIDAEKLSNFLKVPVWDASFGSA